MNIPTLQPLSKKELLHTLMDCRKQLEIAYQETMHRDFWQASMKAMLACEYLNYEINAQEQNYTIH